MLTQVGVGVSTGAHLELDGGDRRNRPGRDGVRILVVGAAGRTGRHVVERALGHGHHVQALIRATALPFEDSRLSVIHGDATDVACVRESLEGVSAVAVCVGGGRGVHERTAQAVLHAMALADVSRASFLSAVGAFARNDPNISLGFRALIATTLKPVYDDLEAMERRVMASGIDWTIVRPSGLSDAPAGGEYRIALDGRIPRKLGRIGRADAGAVMLKALESDAYVRKVVIVGA